MLVMKYLKIFLIITPLIFITQCNKNEHPLPINQATPVNVIEAKKQQVPAILEAVGTVESSHMVDIRARVEGYLDRIAYTEGSMVKMGDLLFQIDPRPFQAKLDSALAELAAQKAILWDAIKIRNRLEPLFKEHAISERDLDNAIARELASEASVESAEANVRMAQLNLGYTSVRAPIDGISSIANYREGSLIIQSMEKPLTTVSSIDPIWINFSLSENVILQHRKDVESGKISDPKDNQFKIQIILADNTIYPYMGSVDVLQPYYNQNTGTLNVRTTFENPNDILKPYQFVKVKVLGAIFNDVYLVPQRAVMQGSRGPFVYIVNKDGVVEVALVELGSWWNDSWIIKGGLQDNDQVVVDGINKIQRGSKVLIEKTLSQTEDNS